MIFQALAYLRFLWHSKNEYSVHSPFVYDLFTKCVYDKTDYPEYAAIADFRRKLLADHYEVEITDAGAGSRRFAKKTRKVSQMARVAGSTVFRSRLLFRLTRYLKSEHILEFGTSLGIGTLSLSLGNPLARIDSVEGSATAAIAQKYLAAHRIGNASIHKTLFLEFIESLPSDAKFDLVFFDGHHDRDATLDYFHKMKKTAHEGTVWIFDDIHWSAGMEDAWNRIIADPDITVSIDTFRWGLAFFRKGQVKEHFVLRA